MNVTLMDYIVCEERLLLAGIMASIQISWHISYINIAEDCGEEANTYKTQRLYSNFSRPALNYVNFSLLNKNPALRFDDLLHQFIFLSTSD
jgi:hypothetical protein